MDLTHWKRNLVVSACLGLLAGTFCAWIALRSPSYQEAGIFYYETIDVKKVIADVIGELRAMPDDELRSISVATRPCDSRLIRCRRLLQSYVTKLAAAEFAQRTADRETEFKERAQKIADAAAQAAKESSIAAQRSAEANERAAQAARESAFAAQKSAWAAKRSADAAVQTVWLAGIGSTTAIFMAIFSILTWFDTRRRNLHAAAQEPTARQGAQPPMEP